MILYLFKLKGARGNDIKSLTRYSDSLEEAVGIALKMLLSEAHAWSVEISCFTGFILRIDLKP